MNTKIAVYICQCGSNISDYVDVNQVKAEIENDKNVVIAKVVMFACADSAQHEIIDDIQTHDLDSIVVASCSPKLHLYTFRDVAVRAGLNPYKYVQVNIREQCSWAHSDNPPKATVKAIKLIRAGIAKAKHSAALKIASISSENTVIVVGAGVTGMSAAIKLAEMGTKVVLVEKDHFVGGRTSQWDKIYPADTTGKELVSRMYRQIFENPNINLLTGTQIISSSGSVGNYQVKVRTTPRNVTSYCSTDRVSINEAIRKCPVEVNDEFNFMLSKRKALYLNHPGQYPEFPVIDHYLCRQCGECGNFFTGRDSTQDNELQLIKAGAIILATGFDPYEPAAGEYEYMNMEQVVTLQQFKRIISDNRGELIYKKRKIRTIA
ncbi:MAG: FAD-dependent oxidoreductase, partial [Bacteroidota bacterium]